MEEAAKFAETTQILMNVSEFTDVSQATDTLISSVQAFGYTAETSMEVVDLLNTIGNNYAISTADLAQSLTKSSASLVAAGGDLAEAAALTATANKIIQDADSVGTALKTTSLRLRGTDVKVLEDEGLDSEGAITSKSKLQGKIKALSGVDILTETGDYKSTYEILSQIADVWEDISNMDQAALLEILAGKRNASVLAAILQNPKELKDAYEDAMNAEGSALKENEKYLDSIQGKIDQFNNAVQTLWSNTLDSDFIKLIVEIGTEIVKLIDKMGSLNLVIAGLFAYLNRNGGLIDFSKLFSGFKEVFSNSNGVKDFFKNLKNGFKNTSISIDQAKEKLAELEAQRRELGSPTSERNRQKADALDQEINKYKEMLKPHEDLVTAQKKLEAAQNRLANASGKSLKPETIKKYHREVDKAQANVDNLTAAQQRAGATGQSAFKKLGTSVKAFGKQVASIITQMLVMWAITKAIELISKGFDNLITTAEEAAEKYEELNSELDTLKDNIKDINNELSTLDDTIAELTAKGSLSFAEKEELERLRAEREELERTLELNEQLAKQKQQQVNAQTSDQVAYYRNKGVKSGKTTAERTGSGALTGTAIGAGAAGLALSATGGAAGLATTLGVAGAANGWNPVGWGLLIAAGIVAAGTLIGTAIGHVSGATEEKVGDSIDNMEKKLAEKQEDLEKKRKKYQKTGKESDKKKYEEAQQALSDYRGEMAQYFTEIDAMYQNVDLSTIEDPDEYKRLKEEMNDFYNERDKWLIESGAEGATSNAIERVFDKKENKVAKEEIESLMEQLKKDPGNTAIEQKIQDVIEGSSTLAADFEDIGISLDTVANSFTQMAEDQAFDTIDGKIKELGQASSSFESLLNGGRFNFEGKNIGLADLFDDEGEIIQTRLSSIFQGTSSETREQITQLLERSYDDIKDGTVNIETLLGEFASRGSEAIISILESTASTFEEISDNIDNIQDSYTTLSNAVEQYNSSGYLTLDNLQSLLSLEPEYLALLQMENGQLTINQAGYESLIQTKLAEAKASVVQSTMKQLNALAARKEADATNEASTAAANSISNLGSYASALSDVAKNAIGAASSVYAFNQAVAGAQANELVTQEEIDAIINNMDTQLQMIDSVGANLSTNFKSIVTGGEGGDPKGDEANDAFKREMDYWENRIAANQAKYEQLQNEIDLLEAKGQKADASFYEEQMKLEGQRLELLNGQKAEALKRLQEIEAAGGEGNEQWWEVANTLNDIESELDDVTASIVELQDAIGEIDTYKFEEFNTRLDNLISKLETMRNLIASDEEDWFDDEGNWTDEGIAVVGTYIQELEFYKQGLEEIKDTLTEFEKIGNGAEWSELSQTQRDAYAHQFGIQSEQEYYEKTEELISQQYEYAESISDTKQSIVDMYESSIDATEEYIETLIDGYSDYIDSVKEALQAERDLYDFKKNVQKQAKDIAEIERRIASLSGSTNKADIAERRKLEAQLYESRESLSDTYYDHAQDAQQEALDAEQEAYETAMTKMVENMRVSLEEATKDMAAFLDSVTIAVSMNADTVLDKYRDTEVPLNDALTNPWEEAAEKVAKYGGDANKLMDVWKADGYFAEFKSEAGTNLSSPWNSGKTAANSFKTSVEGVMSGVVSNIATNVKTASDKLSKLYQQILDTEQRAASANVSVATTTPTTTTTTTPTNTTTKVTSTSPTISSLYGVTNDQVLALGYGPISLSKFEQLLKDYQIKYSAKYKQVHNTAPDERQRKKVLYGEYVSGPLAVKKHAKGITGTKRDEWAITDEPQFGDELVLVPGKDGNLSFMRKGTGVVPAKLTEELMELGKLGVDGLMNANNFGANINMISNAINKPEIIIDVENFLKVDRVDKDTLPQLEAMMDKKIDTFAKQLNYSIKRFSR